MFSGTTIGRVTKDLEVQYSTEKVPYIRFNLAVNRGYGANEHTIFPQCWIFGQDDVDRIVKAKVGKGSLIQLTGDVDLVGYKKKLGGVETGEVTTTMKITVWGWDYVSAGKSKPPAEPGVDPPKPSASLEDFDVVPDEDPPSV